MLNKISGPTNGTPLMKNHQPLWFVSWSRRTKLARDGTVVAAIYINGRLSKILIAHPSSCHEERQRNSEVHQLEGPVLAATRPPLEDCILTETVQVPFHGPLTLHSLA